MSTYSHGMGDYLSDEQIAQLLAGIKAHRVLKANGFSHVQAYDVRAQLTRVFGFARWDTEVRSCDLVFEEEKNGKWTVCYRATVAVVVRSEIGTHLATYSDVATGDAKNQPYRSDAHDMACKTAASQAFKRAAANLGDQFGLGLYNQGKLEPMVRGSLVGMPVAPTGDMTDHITVPLAPEGAENETPAREVSSPPASPTAAPPVAPASEQVSPPEQDPQPVTYEVGPDGELNVVGVDENGVFPQEELSPEAADAPFLDGEGHKTGMFDAVVEAAQAPSSDVVLDAIDGVDLSAPDDLGEAIAGLTEQDPYEFEAPMDAEEAQELMAAEQIIAGTTLSIVRDMPSDQELDAGQAAAEEAVANLKATLDEAFGEMAPVEEPAPSAEPDPFEWCMTRIALARRMQPAEALVKLNQVMEVAVRKQLRARRVEGTNETLGAHLTALMQRAGDAAAKQKAQASS